MIISNKKHIADNQTDIMLWTALIIAGISAVGSIIYLLFYIQTGYWQLLIGVAGSLLIITLTAWAHSFIKIGLEQRAGFLIAISIALLFISLQLVWQGYTLPLLIAGLLLLVPTTIIILPGEWKGWLTLSVLYAISIILCDYLPSYPRLQDYSDLSLSTSIIIFLSIFVLFIILWHKFTYFKDDTIGKRLIRTNVSVILLTMSAIIAFISFTYQHNGRIRLTERLSTLAQFEVIQISDWKNDIFSALKLIARNNHYRSLIEKLVEEDTANPNELGQMQEEIQRYFDSFLSVNDSIDELLFLNDSGVVTAATNPDLTGENYSANTFFGFGSIKPTSILLKPNTLPTTQGEDYFIFSIPVYDADEALLGVLAALVNTKHLDNLFNKLLEDNQSVSIYATNPDFKVIASNKTTHDAYKYPQTSALTENPRQNITGITQNNNGSLEVRIYRWIPSPGFAITLEQDLNKYLMPIYITIAASIILAILSAIIGAMAASIATRSIIEPLTELAETSTRIADGDLNLTVDETRHDELGMLAKAFNRMTQQLSKTIRRLESNVNTLETTKKQLLIAKAEWEQTFNTVPDVITILDTQYKIKQINRAAEYLFDLPQEELIGRNCYEIFHKSDHPPEYCPHRKLLEDHKDHSAEFFDERHGYILVTDTPLFDQNGELIGSVHVSRDITEQKNIEYSLKRASMLIFALSRSAAKLTAAHDVSGLMETLGEELKKLGIACFVALKTDESLSMKIDYVSESIDDELFTDNINLNEFEFKITPDNFPYHKRVITDQQPVFLEDILPITHHMLDSLPEPIVQRLIKSFGIAKDSTGLLIPLIAEDTILGIFGVWGKDIKEEDISALSIFARQVAVAIEKSQLFKDIQRLAKIDELTKVPNRRHLFELGERELRRSKRFGSPLSTIMLDLDHFKRVNDTYGHATGDQVLREVAMRCHKCTREVDVFGRYGGEEFALVLPNTKKSEAVIVANRLREAIASEPIKTDLWEINMTISVGIAELTDQIPDLATLLDRADTALYAAKSKGRNCVVIYPPPEKYTQRF